VTHEDQIAALFAQANPVPSLDVFDQVEPLDIDPLKSRSRRSSVMAVKTDEPKATPARWPRLAWLVAIALIAAVGLVYLTNRNSDVAAPSTTVAPSTTASSAQPPIDTTTWTTYQSERYGFSIGYPSDWTVTPADHDWTLEADADEWLSTGQEVFYPPNHDIRVSAWSVALDPGTTLETSADVEAWIEQYCQLARPSCVGFNDRVVPLCLERRDCHPGLLVPFDTDTQAFFPGTSGNGGDRMVVVALWRIESDASVGPYGGARRLLEAFLTTMDVYPARPDQIP
jgi:hypothetical protein